MYVATERGTSDNTEAIHFSQCASYHGVSTAKCRVRATDRGHLMMSDDFGSKINDEKARQEAATIL